jgi:hypothetical protein
MSEAHLCLGLTDAADVLDIQSLRLRPRTKSKDYITLFEPIFFVYPLIPR